MFSCNKNEEPQKKVEQDTLVSAFFGLDNLLPSLLCNQPRKPIKRYANNRLKK